MRELRTLLLGETRAVPTGVALVVGAALLGDALAGEWWRDAAGPLLLVGVVGVLAGALAPALRRRS
jgi:hypothetical protein